MYNSVVAPNIINKYNNNNNLKEQKEIVWMVNGEAEVNFVRNGSGDKWSSLYIRKLYIWFHKLTYLMR